MIGKVQKWGNSQGLRIAKAVLREAGIEVGDEVSVTAGPGTVVIGALRLKRGHVSLQELVSRMPRRTGPDEPDWGPPVGKEVW